MHSRYFLLVEKESHISMKDLDLGRLRHTSCLYCAQVTGPPPMEFIAFYGVLCPHIFFRSHLRRPKNADDVERLQKKDKSSLIGREHQIHRR